ncbi:MAG TPA: hypothetical protein VFB77_01380 [Acidimicrobiales bacterium]|nr:hypothetical protein [Acidimicrobiales bacterium]
MRSIPARALIAVAPLAVLGSACGGSGYQYVKNDDLGIYAKLPDDWTVYDEEDLFPDASEIELDREAEVRWIRTFDSADDPSVDMTSRLDGSEPAGRVEHSMLSVAQRENLDLGMLRGRGDPARDPLAAQQQGGDAAGVRVIVDDPIEFDGGYSGLHTVFVIENDGSPIVIDQTSVRDSQSSQLVSFLVGCDEECYFETHKDEIADLVDSWTIQEVRS